jgi:dTDP-4-amino-4,6-dideoxygalactose transaminase
LAKAGIPASVVHRRIDRNAVFASATLDLPGQRSFDERQLSLPLHAGLSNADVEAVIEAAHGALCG